MAKNNSTLEHDVGAVELFIIETLLNKGKVVIPDFGHLELKALGERRTVFFKASDDWNDSFLQIMPAVVDKEKKEANKVYALVSGPLKEGETVNLPKVGIFRPNKREDGKVHVSFIPSSYLRKLLNKEKEEPEKVFIEEIKAVNEEIEEQREIYIENELNTNIGILESNEGEIEEIEFDKDMYGREIEKVEVVKKDYTEFQPKSTPQYQRDQRETAKVGDVLVPQDEAIVKLRRNLSGAFLLVVIVLAVTFLVLSNVFHWRSNEPEEQTEFISPNISIDLPSLSEQHYGHAAFWIYIYEANSDKLESPLNIPDNVTLTIPDLKKDFDVDITDSLEIQRANILTDIVLDQLKNK